MVGMARAVRLVFKGLEAVDPLEALNQRLGVFKALLRLTLQPLELAERDRGLDFRIAGVPAEVVMDMAGVLFADSPAELADGLVDAVDEVLIVAGDESALAALQVLGLLKTE